MIFAWQQSGKSTVILDLPTVPDALVRSGQSREALATGIRARIEQMEQINQWNDSKDNVFLATETPYPDIEIPKANMKVSALVDIFRWLRGIEAPHLSGSAVAKANSQLEIQTSMIFRDGHTETDHPTSIGTGNYDAIVQAFSEHFVYLIDPLALGAYYLATHNTDAAARVADRMLLERSNTDNMFTKAHMLKGYVLASMGMFDQAVSEERLAVSQSGDLSIAHNGLAYVLWASGLYPEAENEFVKAYSLNPGDVTGCGNLGYQLFEQNRFDESVKQLKKCAKLDIKNPIVDIDMCLSLSRLGKDKDAESECRKASRKIGYSAFSHVSLALAWNEIGNPDSSLEEATRALNLDPNNSLAYTAKGLVESYRRDFPHAISDFDKASKLDAFNALPVFEMGYVYFLMHDSIAAKEYFTRALKITPKFADAEAGLGLIDLDAHDFDQAKAHFDKAVGFDPRSAMAHTGLGYVTLRRGEANSLAEFTLATTYAPKDSTALCGRARALISQGDFDAALREIEVAKQNDPMLADTFNVEGEIYIKRSRYSDAEASFRKAIELDPKAPSLYTGLGYALMNEKDKLNEAAQTFIESIGMDDRSADSHYGLGLILEQQSRYYEAEAQYRLTIECNPNGAPGYISLIHLLQRMGRLGEAQMVADQARQKGAS